MRIRFPVCLLNITFTAPCAIPTGCFLNQCSAIFFLFYNKFHRSIGNPGHRYTGISRVKKSSITKRCQSKNHNRNVPGVQYLQNRSEQFQLIFCCKYHCSFWHILPDDRLEDFVFLASDTGNVISKKMLIFTFAAFFAISFLYS